MRAVVPNATKLSDLAAALPEPFASQIAAKTADLRALVEDLAEKNRIATSVAQSLHTQVQAVFAAVVQVGQQPAGYGRTGREQHAGGNRLLDAVG